METRPGDERKVPLTSDKGEGGDDHEILLVLLERLEFSPLFFVAPAAGQGE